MYEDGQWVDQLTNKVFCGSMVGTAGSSIDISAVAMPSACSTAGKSSSLSVGAAAVIAVSCTTLCAMFVAGLVGSDGEDLAAGHQEHRWWGFGSA